MSGISCYSFISDRRRTLLAVVKIKSYSDHARRRWVIGGGGLDMAMTAQAAHDLNRSNGLDVHTVSNGEIGLGG